MIYIILFLYFLRLIFVSSFELSPDEAYWWVQSKFFSISYYDHPPLTTYLIMLTTKIFGDTEFAIRVLAVTLNFFSLILLKNIFNLNWSVLFITQSILMFNIGAVIYTHDVVLVFLSLLFCYVYKKVINGLNLWWLLGVIFGLMLLTKYTAILIIPSLLVAEFFRKSSKNLYIFFLISFILFSPVLIWNYLNDFPSFKYRLEAGLVGEASVKNVLNYIFVQLFVLSFPISIYLIFSSFLFLINSIRYKAPFDIFLGVSSIFPFLFFMFTSFFKQADANWPSISQIYMLAVGLKSLKDLKFKNLIYFFSYVWFILVFVLHIHIIYKLFDIKNDRRNELTGWRDFSSFVLELQRKYNAKLYANTYQVASQLTFYTSKIKNEFTLIPALNINSRKNHFEYINYEKPSGVIIYIGSKDNIFGEIIETHNYNHPDGVYEVNVVKLK